MRKITFNDEQIQEIREFANTHRFMEVCNRFTISPDVLHRLMRDHDIVPVSSDNPSNNTKVVSPEIVQKICDLYANTDLSVHNIRKQVNMRYNRVKDVISANFSAEYIANRKHSEYAKSKLGEKNPMYGKFREENPRYKGIVSDGKGYLMCLKPDWYTGRKGTNHVFVHTIVMCEALGLTELPKGWVVHHINGDKYNNDINNLALLTNCAHSRIHTFQRNHCKVQRSEIIRREDEDSSETPDND